MLPFALVLEAGCFPSRKTVQKCLLRWVWVLCWLRLPVWSSQLETWTPGVWFKEEVSGA